MDIKQRKILQSAVEPEDKNFLWLDISAKIPIFKVYDKGKWQAIGAVTGIDGDVPNPPVHPTDPEVNYVTPDDLSMRLSGYVTTSTFNGFTQSLSDTYMTKSGFSTYERNVAREIGTLDTRVYQLETALNDIPEHVQEELQAGEGISITGNVISCTVQGGGTAGVGIASIETEESSEDGGANTITFNFTDESIEPVTFTIRNGSQGDPGQSTEGGIAGKGPLTGSNSATAYAQAHPNTLFQWLLEFTIEHNDVEYTVVKPIWCVDTEDNQPVFVDSNGSVMSES